MDRIEVTRGDLLEALASASEAPEDARTVQEIVEASGVSVKRVREALQRLQRQGRLVAHRVRRPALDGRLALVPAYTIRPAG